MESLILLMLLLCVLAFFKFVSSTLGLSIRVAAPIIGGAVVVYAIYNYLPSLMG